MIEILSYRAYQSSSLRDNDQKEKKNYSRKTFTKFLSGLLLRNLTRFFFMRKRSILRHIPSVKALKEVFYPNRTSIIFQRVVFSMWNSLKPLLYLKAMFFIVVFIFFFCPSKTWNKIFICYMFFKFCFDF